MAIPIAPIITAVRCDTAAPRAVLSLSWQLQSEDYTGPFSIVVKDLVSGQVVPGNQSTSVTTGTWTATANMDLNGTYVCIVQTKDPAVCTDPSPVLVAPITQLTTTFDGETVTLTWQDPTGARPTDVQVCVRSMTASEYFPRQPDMQGARVVPSTFTLAEGDPWWATVAPALGVALGPFCAPPAPIVKNAPPTIRLSVATNNQGATVVSLFTPGVASYSDTQSFGVIFTADRSPWLPSQNVASTKLQDGTRRVDVTIPQGQWPSLDGRTYRVALREVDTNAQGLGGSPLVLPLGTVVFQSVNYLSGTTQDTLSVVLNPPFGEPIATGVAITVLDPQGAPTGTVATLSGFAGNVTLPKVAAPGYSIVAASMIGTAMGLPGPAKVSIVTQVPALGEVVYDQNAVAVTWTPTTQLCRLSLLSANAVVAQGDFSGGAASLALPAGTGSISVQLAALEGPGMGNPTTGVAVIADVPSIQGITFATDGSATVTFGATTGLRLRYQVMSEGKVLQESELAADVRTATLAANLLSPAQDPVVRARCLSATTNPESVGPWCASGPLIAKQPTDLRASYDGRTATVAWAPVPSPRVSGYRIIFLADGVPVGDPVAAARSPITVPLTLDRTKNNTVTVQSMAGSWGGKASAPLDLHPPCFHLSTNQSQAPYLVPAQRMDAAPHDINLYLPDLFAVPPTGPLPDKGVFKLQTTDQAPFQYVLVVPMAGGAWTFTADPIRPAVKAAYEGLLTDLAALGASAVGLNTVREAIARALPTTFTESLFYAYGLDLNAGVVDLRPGCLLRASFESYQYLGTGVANASYLNGFVGSNEALYEVTSTVDVNGRWFSGFDAFLARMAQYMIIPAPTKSQGKAPGGAGAVDFCFDNFRQPFCRVVYPSEYLGQTSTGTPYPSYNIAIVAAPSLQALQQATTDIRNHNDQVDSAAVLYLRGRATVTPSVRVWVQGAPLVVPLGTTAGNLLETLGRRPPILGLPLDGLSLIRARSTALGNPLTGTAGIPLAGGWPVRFDWDKNTAYSPVSDWLDLPLMHGDHLRLVETP